MPYQSITNLIERFKQQEQRLLLTSGGGSSSSTLSKQQNSVLYLISIVLIAILSLHLTSISVQAQYAITSYPDKYFAGIFILTFNSSLPVSVGTSPFSDTNTNTSVVFSSLIKYSAKETNKVVIITGTSSNGDYLVFTSPSLFTVNFEITIGYETLTTGKRTVYIPSFGIQRFYSYKQIRKGKHNNLVLMSGNVNQQIGGTQTIYVGFTFNSSETVQLIPYTLSTLNYKILEIEVPPEVHEIDEDHYVPFYLQIQCAESELCRLVINLFNVEDDAPYLGTVFGIVLGSLLVCLKLLLCVVIGSFCYRRRRGIPIVAFIEPQKVQMGTVQYYSPTMHTTTTDNTITVQQPASAVVATSNYFSAEPGVVVYPQSEPTQVVLDSQDVHQYDSKV